MAPGTSSPADHNSTHSEESFEGGQEALDVAEGRDNRARLGRGAELPEQQQGYLGPQSPRERGDRADKDDRTRRESSNGSGDGHQQQSGGGTARGDAAAARRRNQEQRKSYSTSAEGVGVVTSQRDGYPEHDGLVEKGEYAEALCARCFKLSFRTGVAR